MRRSWCGDEAYPARCGIIKAALAVELFRCLMKGDVVFPVNALPSRDRVLHDPGRDAGLCQIYRFVLLARRYQVACVPSQGGVYIIDKPPLFDAFYSFYA